MSGERLPAPPRLWLAAVTLCLISHRAWAVVIDTNGDVLQFNPSVNYCADLTIKTRYDCGLRTPQTCRRTGAGRGAGGGARRGLDKLVCHVVLHNSHVTSTCDATDCCNVVQDILQTYLDQDKCDLPFNFMIDNRGIVYEGRGWRRPGHISNPLLRPNSFQIAFLANPISYRAKEAYFKLIYCGRNQACINWAYSACAHPELPFAEPGQISSTYLAPGSQLVSTVSQWAHYNCQSFTLPLDTCCKCEHIHQECGQTRNVPSEATCLEAGETAGGGGNIPNIGQAAQKARDNEYPFMVNVDNHCGGVIIHCQYILTAAHCVTGKYTVDVWVGSTSIRGGSKLKADVIPHEDFLASQYGNDIAILKLRNAFTRWTDAIKPICLPTAGPNPNSEFNIAGWGAINIDPIMFPRCLRRVGIDFIDNVAANLCLSSFANPLQTGLLNDQFALGTCDKTQATFTGSITGDSGGPVFHQVNNKWVLAGIALKAHYKGLVIAADVKFHMDNWQALTEIVEEIATCPA